MGTASYQNQHRHSHNSQPESNQAGRAVLTPCIDMDPAGGAVTLQASQHLRIRDAFGWTVQAMVGTVWITQESDSRDIVLRPGDSFILDRKGAALLSSLGDAQICVKQVHGARQTESVKKVSKFLPSFSMARALFS